MSPLDALALRARARPGGADAAALIAQLGGLVRREARVSGGRWGVDRDDLTQQGAIGILDALGRWDPERGAFLPVAQVWIRYAIIRYCERQSDVSRPRSKAELWIARHAGL